MTRGKQSIGNLRNNANKIVVSCQLTIMRDYFIFCEVRMIVGEVH